MKIQFKLLPHQKRFTTSKKRYTLNSGGVGSGKTYSIVLKALKIALEYPGIFGLIGARTFPQLRNTTLREFLQIIPFEIVQNYNKSNSHFTLKNGSEIIFKSFDDEQKLKSYNLGFLAIEEMSDVPEEIFKMARTRIRQYGFPGFIFGATNPSSFGNWVYKYFIEQPIENSEIIYSKSIDNDYLPQEYLRDLEQLRTSNPEYYKRMVEGIWGQMEGVIYNLSITQRIEISNDLRFEKYIAGLDFGFTHPTALLIIGVKEDRYYLVEEVYQHKMTSGDIIKIVSEKYEQYNFTNLYCDYARPEIIEDLKRANLPAEDANKSVFDGIMYCKSIVNENRLFVDVSCNYTLREFDSYIWDSSQKVKEVPLKINDDCMDSLRYALFTDRSKIKLNYTDRFYNGSFF